MKPWVLVAVVVLVLVLSVGGATVAVMIGQGYFQGKPVDVPLGDIGNGQFLEVEAAQGFLRMVAAAKEAGLDLHTSGANSAFRTPEQQQGLIGSRGAYGSGGYAAAVNFSPHQTGRAVDVANVSPGTSNYDAALDMWLTNNCQRFGWYRVGLSFRTVEPWHLEFRQSLTSLVA